MTERLSTKDLERIEKQITWYLPNETMIFTVQEVQRMINTMRKGTYPPVTEN